MPVSMSVSKGCWTCKDRKVSCDRTTPTCLRCSKSNRSCGGYGIRLSWPTDDNQKRAVIKTSTSKNVPWKTSRKSLQWINIGMTDVRLHLLATIGDGPDSAKGPISRDQLIITHSIGLTPSLRAADDTQLLLYFENVVSKLLPMIGSERPRITRTLMNMALSNQTPASRAVLHALLALASHHRGNDPVFAAQMKHSAVQILLSTTSPDMDSCTAIEHIAAGIVLCTVDMQHSPPSCWITHITGTRTVITALSHSPLPPPSPPSPASLILSWVFYFDTFTRFSLRHWRTESIRATAMELGFDSQGEKACALQYIIAKHSFAQEVKGVEAFAHPLVRLVAQVLSIRMGAEEAGWFDEGYQKGLDALRAGLEGFDVEGHGDVPGSDKPSNDNDHDHDHDTTHLQLLRLSALIYLERISRSFSGASPQLSSYLATALSLISTLDFMPAHFTLFVIGCEARTDEERGVLLSFFARMQTRPHLISLFQVKSLVESAWIQQDLDLEGGLGYLHKLNLVLSSRDVVPSFM